MHARSPPTPGQTWGRLYDIAVDQYGFSTRNDARDVGVAAQYLTVLAKRGVLEHTGFGLYRSPQVPTTEWTSYMEAVLRVGEGAFPPTTRSWRCTSWRWSTRDGSASVLSAGYAETFQVGSVVKRTTSVEVTTYEGIPPATVARALRDCIGRVPRDRLVDALEHARQRGLVRRREVPDLAAALQGTAPS